MVEANKKVTEAKAEQQLRGQLTQRIKNKSFELLGYEITQVELRLIPYLIYLMTNSQPIDPSRASANERDVIAKWFAAGLISRIGPAMKITRGFWDICNELIYLGYIDLKS